MLQFLETIEGQSGENLSSVVLKFLLINSTTMRMRFVEHFRGQLSASSTPTFRDGVICQTEVGTSNESGEAGRVDLLIKEARGMILGVENKFWADFQPGQPNKYWESVKKEANGDENRCRLVILAPQERESKINKHIADQCIADKCLFVSWESLLTDFKEVMREDRREVAAVASFLHEYVTRQVKDILTDAPKGVLVGPKAEIANDFQYEFLYKMKDCLFDSSKIRPAKDWIGFYFRAIGSEQGGEKYPRQWFGFHKKDGSSKMGIETGMRDFSFNKELPWARVANGPGSDAFIEIDYDESLKNKIEWKEKRLDEITALIAEELRAGNTISTHQP